MSQAGEKRSWWPWSGGEIAPLASLLVLIVFFAVATGGDFLKMATVMQILRQGSAWAIVAVGLTFVLLCGEIDLSVGMMALWGASFCGWLFTRLTEDTVIAAGATPADGEAGLLIVAVCLLLPLLSCLVLGLITGGLTIWAALPSFIISLAMMNVADGLSSYVTQSAALDVPEILEVVGNRGVAITETRGLPYSAILAAVFFLCGHVVLRHTRFGRYVYMTGGNREAARLAGVRTGLVIIVCLAISAFAAGVAGLIEAGRLEKVTQDQNADLLLSAVACVVLGGTSLFGGIGGMGRTAIGVLTFCVLHVGLNQIQWIPDLLRPFVMGAVLMAALVVNGVFGRQR